MLARFSIIALFGFGLIASGCSKPAAPTATNAEKIQPTPPEAWEYSLFDYSPSGGQMKLLNQMGDEGWEVAAVIPGQITSSSTLLLKRRRVL